MRLYYGSYAHDEYEVSISVAKTALMNEAGIPYAAKHAWTVSGQKQADTSAELYAKLLALDAAYNYWYRDLVLRDSNNTIVRSLVNAGSLTGVRILKFPTWPNVGVGGAELSTLASYDFMAEADYPVATAPIGGPGGGLLKSWNETLSFSGGGPRRAIVECVNVLPQPQTLSKYTAYRATQSGQAVGLYGYPPIPPPIWPGAQMEPVQATYTTPTPQGGGGPLTDWGVSWSYTFASPTPLVGRPTVWPGF